MQLPPADIIGLITKSQRGLAISSIIASLALLAVYFSTLTITDQFGNSLTYSLIPNEYHAGIVIWVVSSLVGWSIVALKRQIITIDITAPTCNFCGVKMTTKSLKCLGCGCESTVGE